MVSRDRRDTSRLEGFSDAVFAFAATLLVVSLEVPENFSALVAQIQGFGAFAITFGALVAIWTVHKAFFRRYRLDDGWTVFLNSALLFIVLFYVFPLKFLTETFFSGVLGFGGRHISIQDADELATVFTLYSAGFTAMFVLVAAMYGHAYRRRSALRLNAIQAWEAAYLGRHYLLFAVAGVASMGLAIAGVGILFGLPGLLYVLLGPVCFAHGHWSTRRRPVS